MAMLLQCQLPRLHLAMTLVAVFLVSLVAPAVAATCSQVDKLAVQLPRPRRPEYAGFVVPTSDTDGAPKFADECLDVQVQGGGVNFDPLQELKDGKADIAIAEGSYVAQQIASGESLTIVAGYYQKNGLVFIGMDKALTLKGLSGKKIGAWCCGHDLPFPAIMAKQTPLILTTQVSQNSFSMQQLLDGDVDVASAMIYDELAAPLQQLDSTSDFLKQQSDFYMLDPEDHGITLVHNVVVVRTATVNQANMRAKIVRFLKVVTETWHFCRSNEDACASVFSEYGVPTPLQLWQMREVNHFIFPTQPGYGLGVLSLARWDDMNQWMVASGALASAVSSSAIDNTLALDAGALSNSSQWEANANGTYNNFCAGYSSTAPLRICQGHEHKLCAAGEEPSTSGTTMNCNKCVPGRYAPHDRRMNTCLVCPSGRFSKTEGQSECDECQPGRFWSSTSDTEIPANQTDCTSCPVGEFAGAAKATACSACGMGSSTGKEGSSQCYRCAFGSYVDVAGTSECNTCQEGMATLHLGSVSSSDCVCPKGTYLETSSGDCTACPEGMECKVNSLQSALTTVALNPSVKLTSVGEFPRVHAGYYSLRIEPLRTFLCKEDQVCPGNLPETCAFDNEGLACGKCKAGYFREGLKCMKCEGIDESAFNYPILPLVAGPFVVLLLYGFMRNSREDWGQWWNEILNCFYTVLASSQVLGLLFFTFVQYPKALRDIMMPWSYLVDLASAFRMACSEYADFRLLMIVKQTAPGLVLVIVLLTWAIGWIVGKCMTSICGFTACKDQSFRIKKVEGGWQQSVFPLKAGLLVNLYFAVFNALYIPICFLSLQLFMCYAHPNPTTEWSLVFAPEVFCYSSDEWRGMLTETVFSIILYIVAPIGGFAYIVAISPSHFHKPGFHERWKFLFLKFKPDCFWWGVFHMLRALLLVLTLVFSQTGSRQVYYICVVLLLYATFLVIWWPWRHRSSNLFDLFVTFFLLFFCALSSSFSRRSTWLDDEIAELAVGVSFVPFLTLLLVLLSVGWSMTSSSKVKVKKAKQALLAADCRLVFAKFVGLSKDKAQATELEPSPGEASPSICAEDFINGLSGQNRDILRNACSVIVAELLGHQPGYTGLPWRLVHQDQKSGARTWAPTTAPHPLKEISQNLQGMWTPKGSDDVHDQN